MKHMFYVYGASDDLIEVENPTGRNDSEGDFPDGKAFVTFSNGSFVCFTYTRGGEWKVVSKSDDVVVHQASADRDHPSDVPEYSDVAEVFVEADYYSMSKEGRKIK